MQIIISDEQYDIAEKAGVSRGAYEAEINTFVKRLNVTLSEKAKIVITKNLTVTELQTKLDET